VETKEHSKSRKHVHQ